MSQWSNDAYQSFSLLLGSKPPTGCPTPFGWKHSDDWCDSQILSHTVIHFLPLRSLEVSQNKVPHKTNTWSIKGTFWQLPLKAIPSQSVPLTAANLSRSSIPKQAINHPKQPLIHLLDCFLSNWLSVCLFGFVSSVLWQMGDVLTVRQTFINPGVITGYCKYPFTHRSSYGGDMDILSAPV